MKQKKLLVQLTAVLFVINCNGQEKEVYPIQQQQVVAENSNRSGKLEPGFSFRFAARKTMPAVVHIKTYYSIKQRRYPFTKADDFWYRLYSPDQNVSQLQTGSASGVIVSSDGYIVTNDHVVKNSQSIEVVLNDKRDYKAFVIGTDPATDLALLKIDERQLQFIEFGNSDSVEVGDVVLAVGNPFNLTSTVTSGIISAKARNINMLIDKAAVESYIQTDAVVNKGNSGGALVDINGKLIGVIGAIETPTGVYAGYSFAIPVEIVKKTINDLLKYGKVLRGYLGIYVSDMDADKAKRSGAGVTSGVMVDSLQLNGAAIQAGIKKNDVITKIDGHPVESTPQFREIVARHHPGEKLQLTILRGQQENITWVTLIAVQETVTSESKEEELLKILGIKIKNVSVDERKRLQIKGGGVNVASIFDGVIAQTTNMKEGFIILSINDERIKNISDFFAAMQNTNRLIMFIGIYPDMPGIYYYVIEI